MSDPRFSALSKDPRYRLPSRKEARIAVDPRFGRLFTDQDFRKKARVDRYGRKIKSGSGKKELERLYRLDEPESTEPIAKPRADGQREVVGSSDEDEEYEEEEELVEPRDPAREGGFAESSSSEESSSEEESGDEDELELAEATAGQEQTEDIPLGDVACRIAAVNLDWDNIRAVDLMVVASSFAPTGGKIDRVTIYPSEFGRERLAKEEIEGPPKEIFANAKNLADIDGEDEDEDDEESEGSEDEEEDEKIKRKLQNEQVNEGDEFDTTKLREYQLERLRYYYAVISCDSKETAQALYEAMDGREYLSTANFFDLRFIPDDTSFDDDDPHEECTEIPPGYRPNEFKTQALTHSKVRLTWDDDDATRKEVQKRAFSRAEIDENDLKAYIGSDSSDAESTTSRKSVAESRAAKKEAQRAKMRAALGLSAESSSKASSSRDQPVGDMQITFTSGLSGNASKEGQGVFENAPNESTREAYIRKERERKQKRKDKRKTARAGETDDANEADDINVEDEQKDQDQDQGFDDPFFTDPSASLAAEKQARKAAASNRKQKQVGNAQDDETKRRRAELELLMADDEAAAADHIRHFDMREIARAEKDAARRGKGKKSNKSQKKTAGAGAGEEEGGSDGGPALPRGTRAGGLTSSGVAGPDDFSVETADPRFQALFDSHEYAIDPTNPRFKGTKGMKALLEEGRRKRKKGGAEDEGTVVARTKKAKGGAGNVANGKDVDGDADEIRGLVARLKNRK